MSETRTAVLDRIVDGETAVLLVEDGGRVTDEITVDVAAIPEAGRTDGAVFGIVVDDGDLTEIDFRPDETDSRRTSAQNRFDRLSERLGDG